MDRLMFLKRFIHLPDTIGSITPSTKFLANKMVDGIDWGKIDTVVELGAGTGVITDAICKSMLPTTSLLIFEKDPFFHELIQQKYPNARVFADASRLQETLDAENMPRVDLIVSSLPFTLFNKNQRREILDNIYDSLTDEGTFIAYQYSLKMMTEFSCYFSCSIKFVPLNVPPAFIFVCSKKSKSRI